MKFLTDLMLGRLTRFLRIFGYDTVYAKDLESSANIPVPDEELVKFANKEFRIILTKDKLLSRKAAPNSLFLEGENVYEYLKQIKIRFKNDFEYKAEKARCSVCNHTLFRIENKEDVKDLVNEGTYNHINEFFRCSNRTCNKIYWYGTHIEDILLKIKKIEID